MAAQMTRATAFHDGCMKKDIDSIGGRDAKAGEYGIGLGFDVWLDAKVDVGCLRHDNPSFESVVTQK